MIDCQSLKPSFVIVFSSLLTHFQDKIVHRNEEKAKLAPAYTVAICTLSSFGYLGVNWKNQLFIFGGSTEQRQVSRLSGYKLERIGDLSFDHQYGACSNMENQYIFLCFDLKEDSNDIDDPRRCRRSTGPMKQFSEVALSTHVHRGIQTSCSDSKFLLVSYRYYSNLPE